MSAAKYRVDEGFLARLAAAPAGLFGLLNPANRRGQFLLVLAMLVAVAAGGYAIWRHIRSQVVARDEYRLDPQDIEITPPPPWVHGDLKTEVLRDASLDPPISILDDNLAERIYTAFKLHPWVKEVRVTKRHPAHVDVELGYRRPVAMVEVPDGGLNPVDDDGVLLPSDGISPLEARAYPRLAGIESSPVGPVGTKWGDGAVAGGARIADALRDNWTEMKLYRVRWIKPASNAPASQPALFELVTVAGTVIPWGTAPGSELPGEPVVAQKIARLKSYAVDHGDLDSAAARNDLDLQQPLATPRTANR